MPELVAQRPDEAVPVQPPVDDGKWMCCSSCGLRLCREENPGEFVVQHKRNQRTKYHMVIFAGAIVCPRCGSRQAIPPLKRVATREALDAR
jgi:hypothetical protein